MITLSDDALEKCFGDDAILKYLEMGREAFIAGDRLALLAVIFWCARYQAVIPEWAADALLKAEVELESGGARDPNEVFGWPNVRKGEREKNSRQKELAPKVVGALMNHRLAGGGLNADIDLQLIANELGISRRDVEEIYKHHGQFVKDLPRENPNGGAFSFGMGAIQPPRRKGRPALKDEMPALDTKSKNPVSD